MAHGFHMERPNAMSQQGRAQSPTSKKLDSTSFPATGFTYYLLSLQSTFQLSLTVLVYYRTRASI